MGILSWIVLGLIAGYLAKLILPGKDPGGLFMTIVIGAVGGVVGGFISTALGFVSVDGLSIGSIAIAVLGAIGLLIVWRIVRNKSAVS
jgi:uncharacterized membrane protein YeaQ/YmgE (transglycosylase-associated protein family)